MSELKACPHCAGSDIRIDKHPNRDGREKMVEQWNRRAPAVNADREMTYEELLSTYAGQCQLTDELAAKLAVGSDKALLSRIAELEAGLATMNKRYSAAIAAKPQPDQPERGKMMHCSKLTMWFLFNWQWVVIGIAAIAIASFIVWWKS